MGKPRHGRLLLGHDHGDQHRHKYAPHPPSRLPDQCQPAARTWEEPHPIFIEERGP